MGAYLALALDDKARIRGYFCGVKCALAHDADDNNMIHYVPLLNSVGQYDGDPEDIIMEGVHSGDGWDGGWRAR